MNKKYVDISVVIVIFFVCLYIYTKIMSPLPINMTSIITNKQNLFQVQGSGTITHAPNTALISFGVTKNAATVTDAQNQTNTATSNILQAMKALGIDTKDITTTDYSIDPQYNYNDNNQITGYTVTQTIDVKIFPLDKANKAIDAATANGANIVGGVTFTLDDETKKLLEEKARTIAINDAKQKAQSLASAAGIHLGRVVDVQETADQPIVKPLVMSAGRSIANIGQTTQLPAGQSTITSNVTISYQTY